MNKYINNKNYINFCEHKLDMKYQWYDTIMRRYKF